MSADFEVVWEVEPVTEPDRSALAAGLAIGAAVTDRFLVPDNPTARPAVSSLVVAREVQRVGGDPTVCLNARDRNLLGLRRDLLTAAWHDLDDFLFVHGDAPAIGERAGGLTVRTMLDVCHDVAPGARVGVSARLGRLPAWKRDADRLFVQVSWSIEDLLRWRESTDFDGDVYPAVLVVPSAAMARRLSLRLPELRVPDALIEAVALERTAGVDWACRFVEDVRASGAFAGVHLIAGVRGPDVAARLSTAGLGTRRALADPATGRRGRPPRVRAPDPAA